MDKCRICLKSRKNLHPLNQAESGVTFLVMMSFIANIEISVANGMPAVICLSCRKKLCEVYDFKINFLRSEMMLNESSNLKRINFNNINDIKFQIEIETDCKTMVPIIENYDVNSLKNLNIINYHEVLIKRVPKDAKENKELEVKKEITVKEFLNSVHFESDNNDCAPDSLDQDCESDYEYDVSLESRKKTSNKRKKDLDSDYEYGAALKPRKGKSSKPNKGAKIPRFNEYPLLAKPIKPIYLGDVLLVRTKLERKIVNRKLNKRKPVNRICAYCGKMFLASSIKSHMLKHTGERSFKCDRCPKSFNLESTLKSHQKVHGNKSHKCEQCSARFVYYQLLQSHIRFVHTDERKYICDICSKAFKQKTHMLRHKLIHNPGNKPISCDQCTMTFNTKYALNHHIRIHTRERPFNCEICSQPYSYRRDFMRHCLKKHGLSLCRRTIKVLNKEVVQQELDLLRDLTLHAQGVIEADSIMSKFDGPQGYMAFKHALEVVKAKQFDIHT